ncbi:dihydrodipicolinate synthase family protein [Candidatus Pelagibacter sp.]|nr:dihydrodipicolinate synthase family protein [Candidatus Pelagibacter sp.]
MNKIVYTQKKLNGPIFSIITPFNNREKIDYLALKSYLNYLYLNGARNFYVMVYNTRLSLLTEKEIKKINVFCIKQVKKLNKNNIIICAEPYHSSTEQTINYVNYFKKNGADIVSLIFGEKFYADEQLYSHFKKIHNKTKCLLLLHQQILENGISSNPPFVYYSLNVLKKISKLPRFIAMKEDAKNETYTKMICKKISNQMTIITSGGGKRQWLKAAKHGCTSWLSGVSNLNPKISIDFYDYYKSKNVKKMNMIIKNIEDPFFKIKNQYGWHLTIKAFLELNKNFKRYERSPLKEINKNEMLKCKKVFEKIKKQIEIKKLAKYLN